MPTPGTPVLLSDCVAWVEGILNRQDLNAKLNDSVVNFYKLLCRKIPFDELMYTSLECPLTSGQTTYNLDTIVDVNGDILDPVLKSIYSIRITFGPQTTPGSRQQSNSLRLRRSAARLYQSLSYSIPGQTSTYARFGKTIEVNPAPNAANWTLLFKYWGIAPINNPNPEATVILMDDDWAELIRWELLYRAYYMLGNTTEAMALVQPGVIPMQPGAPRRRVMSEVGIIPRLWNDLCATLSARENADEDFSINPVVRNYSIR